MPWSEILCSDPEHPLDEADLPNDIALRQPAYLSLADHVHRLVPLDRSQSPVDRSEPEAGSNPLLHEAMVLFNGLITNDKFCLARLSRQKLRYARRPRVSACAIDHGCEYLRDERHRGGANEAAVENSASVSTDHGCRAPVGSGLPTSPGMEYP